MALPIIDEFTFDASYGELEVSTTEAKWLKLCKTIKSDTGFRVDFEGKKYGKRLRVSATDVEERVCFQGDFSLKTIRQYAELSDSHAIDELASELRRAIQDSDIVLLKMVSFLSPACASEKLGFLGADSITSLCLVPAGDVPVDKLPRLMLYEVEFDETMVADIEADRLRDRATVVAKRGDDTKARDFLLSAFANELEHCCEGRGGDAKVTASDLLVSIAGEMSEFLLFSMDWDKMKSAMANDADHRYLIYDRDCNNLGVGVVNAFLKPAFSVHRERGFRQFSVRIMTINEEDPELGIVLHDVYDLAPYGKISVMILPGQVLKIVVDLDDRKVHCFEENEGDSTELASMDFSQTVHGGLKYVAMSLEMRPKSKLKLVG